MYFVMSKLNIFYIYHCFLKIFYFAKTILNLKHKTLMFIFIFYNHLLHCSVNTTNTAKKFDKRIDIFLAHFFSSIKLMIKNQF